MRKFKKYLYQMSTVFAIMLTFYGCYSYFLDSFETTCEAKKIDMKNEVLPSTDFIHVLRQYGEDFLEYDSKNEESPLYDYLQFDSEIGCYTMDSVLGTDLEKKSGNITGIKVLPENGLEKSELDLTLSYNTYFAMVYERIPEAAWIYYTSECGYINMYPWVSSENFTYSEKLKSVPFYSVVTPENNPLREAVWTPVYFDEGGKGLMVTLSSPIYHEDKFIGVVSIDLTTETLSKIINSQYACYLIDKTGLVLSTNENVDFQNEIVTIDTLMETSESTSQKIKEIEDSTVQRVGTNYIFKYDIETAPWTMIMTISVYTLLLEALLFSIPIIIICILLIITLKEVDNRRNAEDKIKNIAITDELTGLNNRYYLDSIIDGLFAKSERYNEHLSIAILDLDHFKIVNDTWGHPIGDEVLKQTADITKSLIRSSDILTRIGGEEFLIVLPQTDIHGASIFAEKVRDALEQRNHPVAGKVTASFGIAERTKDEPFISLYKRVDEALYLAKESGRNRVARYEARSETPLASIRLEWNDKWNCGEKNIDNQHRELLNHANALFFLSISNTEHDKMAHQVDLLIKHILNHFVYEESVQLEVGYPDHDVHIVLHKELIEKALKLKKDYRNEKIRPSVLFSFMVDDVIMGHMLEEDVKFFPYIHK